MGSLQSFNEALGKVKVGKTELSTVLLDDCLPGQQYWELGSTVEDLPKMLIERVWLCVT